MTANRPHPGEGDGLVRGEDGRLRCAWGDRPDDYRAYHDDEWGRPVHGDSALLERLVLEGFQSGLSWLTILRKRPAFRAAFAGFDPFTVAAFTADDVERLLGDAGIVRHRRKIEAAVTNARATAGLLERVGPGALDHLVWSHAPDVTTLLAPRTLGEVPRQTEESRALARELKSHGFTFVGPTTVYAAMQACGLVNDHIVGCARRARL
jgi:DNA-3-methyladenine glycosylase I